MTCHQVYRFYDAGDDLLYVGETKNFAKRFPSHAQKKWCRDRAASVVIDTYPSKWEALRVEAVTIRYASPSENSQRQLIPVGVHRLPIESITYDLVLVTDHYRKSMFYPERVYLGERLGGWNGAPPDGVDRCGGLW